MVRARTKRQRGAILLAVAGLLVVLALAWFAGTVMHQQQRILGQNMAAVTVLNRLDLALTAFVARNRRLPCPAPGGLVSGAIGAGIESINPGTGACVPATQINGVVPWTTLGLTEEEALDPWNGRISYRVQPALASNTLNLMNMSWCDPAGTPDGSTSSVLACPASCSGAACKHPLNYLYGKGLQVQDGSGAWLNQPAPPWPTAPAPPPPVANGAAYVLISHGPNGFGAYTIAGGSPRTGTPGTRETPNLNGAALTATSIFIDAQREDSPTAMFDDQLSHPTLSVVLDNAALGPRTPH